MRMLVSKVRLFLNPRAVDCHVMVRQELFINERRHWCIEDAILLQKRMRLQIAEARSTNKCHIEHQNNQRKLLSVILYT